MSSHRTESRLARPIVLLVVALLAGCAQTQTIDGRETPAALRALTPPPPELPPGPDELPPAPRARPAPLTVRPAPATPTVTPSAPAALPPLPRIELVDSAADPAPPPPPPVSPTTGADPLPELRGTLEAWRQAWAARDVVAYLAHYVPEYKASEATPEAWRATRKRVLTSSGPLEIRFGTPDIQRIGKDRAEVVFEQYYRSEKLADVGSKRLELVRRDGRWLIERERFTPLK